MRMLIPVSMFAKVEDLCESTRDFSIVAVQFLCEPELQSDSVEFLNQIMRHKLPFEVFSRLLELIPKVSAPLLHPVLPAIAGGESLPEDIYESLILQRSYAEMVFSLLSENITQATGKYYLQSTPGAHEKLGAFVTLMVNLISQPSWRLAGDMTKEWTKVSTHTHTHKHTVSAHTEHTDTHRIHTHIHACTHIQLAHSQHTHTHSAIKASGTLTCCNRLCPTEHTPLRVNHATHHFRAHRTSRHNNTQASSTHCKNFIVLHMYTALCFFLHLLTTFFFPSTLLSDIQGGVCREHSLDE